MDRLVREDPAPAPQTAPPPEPQWRAWFDARLNLRALYRKYGRKAFPVHSSFFLGEMAGFAFLILVLTGIYLGLIYVPSTAELAVGGQTYPEAYASVRLIESIPVANLFRNTHHWAAHLMVASVVLHLLRVFFTGAYRFPREINWVVGVGLLGLTLMAGFVGYALPFDAFAVTATGIGYGIARSIPWVGGIAAELFFGGAYPTLGSLARLYTIHVFIVPTLLALLIAIHLTIILKQKHTQPGYARAIAEPGKILGVPLWPYQALLAGELFLLMFAVLFVLSAFVSPHPLAAYGPPGPTTPEVKPDWYLLWIYGFLKIVPSQATVTLFGATIGPNFLGGLLFPALLFGVLTLTPWLDRTNRRAVRMVEYLEPVRQSPVRLASGLAVLTFIGMLFVAAYYDVLGLSLAQIWAIVIGVPVVVGVVVWLATRATEPSVRFDPHAMFAPAHPGAKMSVLPQIPQTPAPTPPALSVPPPLPIPAEPPIEAVAPRRAVAPTTPAARGERARDNLVAALHEAGELAPLVRQLEDGPELMEVLDYIDSLRLTLGDSNRILQGVVRGEEAIEPAPRPGGDGPAPI
ncbi:MAG: cytochrome bc complex cytochrome b subunit [Thermomicrobiales bacterium]|nr:cytochrome bc complex cytochrome b subunit [Thermomicrobiales bacterium]